MSAFTAIPRNRGGVPDATGLGTYLRRFMDRPCDGLKIERVGERSGSALWRVVGEVPMPEEFKGGEEELPKGEEDPANEECF